MASNGSFDWLGKLAFVVAGAFLVLWVVLAVLHELENILLIGLLIILVAVLVANLFFRDQLHEYLHRKAQGEHYLPPHERKRLELEAQRPQRRLRTSKADDVIIDIADHIRDDPKLNRKLKKRLEDEAEDET